MHNFPPNIDPQVFTLSAAIIGYALIGDYNIYEQNAIGNWLFMLGQYMITHASQEQLIQSRTQNNTSYKKNQNHIYDFDLINGALDRIKEEINNFK